MYRIKNALIFLVIIFSFSQIFPNESINESRTESKLRGMAGISSNGNNFVSTFWADTLMVNPAFGVYLKAKWGFTIENTFETNIRGTNNSTAINIGDHFDSMFLFNLKKLVFGFGGKNVGLNIIADTTGNISVPATLGLDLLFAINVTGNFKFGIIASFYSHSFTNPNFLANITPGFMWFYKQHRFSLAIPLKYSYISTFGLSHQLSASVIFVDDIKVNNNVSIRIPARIDATVKTNATTFDIDLPGSIGIAVSSRVIKNALMFIGTDIKIGPSITNNSLDNSYITTHLAPTFSAGIEGAISSKISLRAGLSADICNFKLVTYKNSPHTTNTFTLFTNPRIATGLTFNLKGAYRLDIASELQYLGSTIYWETANPLFNYYNFMLTLRVAISLFSD